MPAGLPTWLLRFELSPGKTVYVPDEATKKFGRELKEKLEARWQPPEHFIHLGRRGHVRSLDDHLGSTYFARIDIKSFFSSIQKNRITRHLTPLLRNYKEARTAATMSTVPLKEPGAKTRYVLPFGFVQSPLLATLCLAKTKLGRTIRELRQDFTVTVYVDDILISTTGPIVALQGAYDQLLVAAATSGFEVNTAKLLPPSETTTVFNIVLAHQDKRVSHERFEKFRADLERKAANVRAVGGIISYVRSVNPQQADELTN
jgi:hypothetical protein